MLKGNAVTNTITIIGIAVIGALMFTKVPGMIDDIKIIMSKTSVIGKAAELADQLTLSISAPDEIKLIYKLVPEDISYTVSVKDGIVNVSTDKDWAASKTISTFCFREYPEEDDPEKQCKPAVVKTLVITKGSIEKVE